MLCYVMVYHIILCYNIYTYLGIFTINIIIVFIIIHIIIIIVIIIMIVVIYSPPRSHGPHVHDYININQ